MNPSLSDSASLLGAFAKCLRKPACKTTATELPPSSACPCPPSSSPPLRSPPHSSSSLPGGGGPCLKIESGGSWGWAFALCLCCLRALKHGIADKLHIPAFVVTTKSECEQREETQCTDLTRICCKVKTALSIARVAATVSASVFSFLLHCLAIELNSNSNGVLYGKTSRSVLLICLPLKRRDKPIDTLGN